MPICKLLNYRPCFNEYSGGVTSVSVKHYIQVNGFPNVFWGWGGEDDDLFRRYIKEI